MQIFLNGEPFTADSPLTVAGLVQQLGLAGRRVAVEVNREIVPKSQHDQHQLQEEDQVEVVAAIGGG